MNSLNVSINRYFRHNTMAFLTPQQLISIITLVAMITSWLTPLAQANELAYRHMGEKTSDFATVQPRNLPQSLLNGRAPYYPPKPTLPAPKDEDIFTYTDAQGYYQFVDLDKGTHKVTLDLQTLIADLRPLAITTAPLLWLNPGDTLTSAPTTSHVRFTASYEGTTISGHVFVDSNGNGQFDAGEPGVPNVKVIDPTVHVYFVPFNDTNLSAMLKAKTECYTNIITASSTLESFIYLTAASDDTVYYYDHWEDGYDADPLNPTSSTTEVAVLGAGTTKLFNSTIVPGNIGSLVLGKYYYDGRDRITILGTGATVIRQAYPQNGMENPGPTQFNGIIAAAAWEIPEVANWGSSYIATVGEDLDFNGGLPGDINLDDHDFTGLSVTVSKDNTEVFLNGVSQGLYNINSPFFINGANNGAGAGGVNSGDKITASNPIEVHLLSGGCNSESGDGVSSNGYELEPANTWTNQYYVPVPGFAYNAATCTAMGTSSNPDTDIYLHNPDPFNPIQVNVITNTSTQVTIPANSTRSLLKLLGTDISTGTQGVILTSTNTFWGVSTIDSTSIQTTTKGTNYDWGYSLIPINNLSSQVVLGYSPGNGAAFPTDNGNLAFVMPSASTTIYVDLDQNGTPDKVDLNGDGDTVDTNVFGLWNETTSNIGIPVVAGQVLRIGSPTTRNMQGAMIYTSRVEDKIAVAWGQDPCRAGAGSPYLDNGNTVLPSALPILTKKDDEVFGDADGSGSISPGDTLTYTLELFNNSILGDLNNPILTDTLPFTYAYLASAANISAVRLKGVIPQTAPVSIQYFDGATLGNTAVSNTQQIRIKWSGIFPLTLVTITFRMTIRNDLPVTITEITNSAEAGADTIKPVTSQDPDDPIDPDTDTPIGRPILSVSKKVTSSPLNLSATGMNVLTYTVLVSNTGNGPATGLVISDVLPFGLSFVTQSLQISYPIATITTAVKLLSKTTVYTVGFYDDNFDDNGSGTTGYNGVDGTLSWTGNWIEMGENDGISAGNIQVQTLNPLSNLYSLLLVGGASARGLQRSANLTALFQSPKLQYGIRSNNATTETNDIYIVHVNGTPVFSEAFRNTTYSQRVIDLSAYKGSSSITIGFSTTNTMESGDRYFIDNVTIYESSPYNKTNYAITTTQTSLTYTQATNQNPASYSALTRNLVITQFNLPANSYLTMTYRVTVATPYTNQTWVTNSLVLTSPSVAGSNISQTLVATAPAQILSSHALTLTKTAIPDPVAPGSFITYTLMYSVSGNDPAPNLTISDTLPLSTTFSSASAGGVHNSGRVTWALGNHLTATSGITFQSGTVTVAVQLAAGYTGTTVANTARLTDSTGLSSTATVTVTVSNSPTLVIAKSSVDANGAPLMPGDVLSYTIVVTNIGGADASNVTISDTLPANTTYITNSITGGNTRNNSSPFSWTILSLAMNTPITLTFGVTVNNGVTTGTNIINTAVVTASNYPTPTTALVTNTVVTPQLGLLLLTNNIVTVTPGSVVTHFHTLINVGNITDVYTLTVPSGTGVPSVITVTLGPNQAISITTVVTVPITATTGLYDTTILSATSKTDPTIQGTTTDQTYVTASLPLLTLTKSSVDVNGAPLFAGDVLTYRIVVRNTGAMTATNVTISDTLPANTTYINNSIAGGDSRNNSSPFSWTIASLAINTSMTVTFGVTVNNGVATGTNIINTAVVTASNYPTPTTAMVTNTVVTPSYGLQLLTDNSSTLNPGGTASYPHTLINTGNMTDTYTITVLSGVGVPTIITVTLGPGQSTPLNVIVNVPNGTPAGLFDTTRIQAVSWANSNVSQVRTDVTTVVLTPTPTPTPTQTPTPNFALNPNNESTVPRGQTVNYHHTLTNTGQVTDTYVLTIASNSGFSVTLSTITITLGPGQSYPLTVSVTVPLTAPIGAVDTTVITATSTVSPTLSHTVTDITRVPDPDFALNPNNESTVPRGQTVNYHHTLTNTGQVTDTYVLTIASNSGFSVTLSTITITLGPGQSYPLTVTVTVPLTAPIGAVDTTVITATSTVSPTLSHTVTDITRVPDPNFALNPNNESTVPRGQTVNYHHTLTNTGQVTDTYVLTIASNSGFSVTLSTITVTLGPGQSYPLTVTVTVPLTAPIGAVDTTVITATSTVSPTLSHTVTDITRVPDHPGFDLDINNLSMGNPGQVISYPHVITNTGQVTDTYTITVVSNNGWHVTSSILTVTLGPGESKPFFITVTVPITATPGITDIATISASPLSNPTLVDTVRDITLTPTPSVEINPPHTSVTEPGKTVTYTHVVTNHGSVTDTFTVTVISSNGFTVTSNVVTLTLGPGQSTPLTVTVTIPLTAPPATIDTMTVTVTSITTPTVTDTVTNTTKLLVPGVEINPPHTSVTEPGTTVTYTHLITNHGNFTDTFTVTVISSNGFTVTSSIVTVTLGPGESGPLTVTVTIPPTATISTVDTMTVTVTSTTNPTVKDTVTNTTLVIVPDVQTTKADILLIDADNDNQPSPGDTLRYDLKITNHGNGTARGVVLTDLLSDPNLTLVPNSVTTTHGVVVIGAATVKVNIGDLAPNETALVSFAAQIANPLPVNVTLVANQSLVSGENFPTKPSDDPETPNPNDETETPVVATPKIEAYKSDILLVDKNKDGFAAPGDTLRYVITVTNFGNTAGQFILMNDYLDPNTTLIVGSVVASQGNILSGNQAGDVHVRVDVGNIAAGASVTIRFEAKINDPLPANVKQVANQAIIAGENFPSTPTDDPETPPKDDETVTPVVLEPLLNVYKKHSLLLDADNSGFASPGDTLVYQIQVVNSGNMTGTLTFLKDTLDANTTLVVGSVQTDLGIVLKGNNAGDTQVQVKLGDIAPNAIINLSFAVTVNNPLPANVTQVANQAVVSGSNFPPTPSDNPQEPPSEDETITALQTQPLLHAYKRDSLWVDANGNGVPSAGDTLIYHITLVNRGNGAANNVVFTDIITDPYLTLITGTTQSDLGTVTQGNGANDSNISLTIGTLPVGAEVHVSFQVRIADPLPATVDHVANQGLVKGSNTPPTPTEDPDELCPILRVVCNTETQTPVFQPSFTLTKVLESPSPTFVTEFVTYTIRITNTGNTKLVTVPLSDVYESDYLTFIEAKPAPDRLNALQGEVTWTDLTTSLGDLAPGASFSVQVIMRAKRATPDNDPASNLAIVKHATDEHGTEVPEIKQPSDIEVVILPNISLSKVLDTPQPIFVGHEVTFTIRITNEGRTTIVNLPLEDNYEAIHLQYLRAIPPHDLTAAGVVTWTDLTTSLGDVLPQQSVSVKVAFKVLTQTTSTINSATARNAIDNLGQNVSASGRAFMAVSMVGLELVKTDHGVIAVPGRTLTYTLNYTNHTDSVLTGLTLLETVPLSTTFSPSQSDSRWRCLPNAQVGSQCTLNVGTLASGQGGSVQFVVTLDNFNLPKAIVNTAVVTSEETVSHTHTITTPVGQPLLHFLKTVAPTQVVSPGDRLVYSLCYSNTGSQVARQVVITDSVPTNTTYIPNSVTKLQGTVEFYHNGSWSTQEPPTVSQIRWLVGDVPANGPAQCVTFAVTVNQVLVAANIQGQTRQLEYTEQGWRVLPRSIYLPLLLNGEVITSDGVNKTDITRSVNERIIPFEQVNVTIPNTALIGAQDLPPQSQTVTNTVVRLIDPIITKEANVSQAHVGDVVDYFIKVFNPSPPGNAAALGLVISDVMPIQLDLVSYEVSRPDLLAQVRVITNLVPVIGHPLGIKTAVATTVTMTIPVLAQNETVSLHVRARVNNLANPAPQTIRNIAILGVPGRTDPPPTAEVIVDVPAIKPTPVRPKEDDDDDNSAHNPPNNPAGPTATPTPGAGSSFSPPTATPPAALPVNMLPETGQRREARSWAWLGGLMLLGGLSLLFYRRR